MLNGLRLHFQLTDAQDATQEGWQCPRRRRALPSPGQDGALATATAAIAFVHRDAFANAESVQ